MSTPEYSVTERPEVPVVWLDSHAISDIASAVRRGSPAELIDTWELMSALRRSGRLFSFESDQLYEIERKPSLVDSCTTILTHLSQGISTSYLHANDQEIRTGMTTALASDASAELRWSSIFRDDPFKDTTVDGLLVRADFLATEDDRRRRRDGAELVASEWEDIRQHYLALGLQVQERRRRAFDREQLGVHEALTHMTRLAQSYWNPDGHDPSEEESGAVSSLAPRLADWRHLGGGGIADMLDFYKSDYFLNLPHVSISSWITAQRIAGGERIKPSDVMDIHHIASFMPYCTHMVIDKAMINAVHTDLGLDKVFVTTLLRLSDLQDLLSPF